MLCWLMCRGRAADGPRTHAVVRATTASNASKRNSTIPILLQMRSNEIRQKLSDAAQPHAEPSRFATQRSFIRKRPWKPH